MINKDKIFSELENRLFQARQAFAILSEEIKIQEAALNSVASSIMDMDSGPRF